MVVHNSNAYQPAGRGHSHGYANNCHTCRRAGAARYANQQADMQRMRQHADRQMCRFWRTFLVIAALFVVLTVTAGLLSR
jgi:hypothetical protein